MSQDPNDPSNSANSAANVPAGQPFTITFPTNPSGWNYISIPVVTSAGNIIYTIGSGTLPSPEEDKILEIKTDKDEGCTCIKCKEFNEYAKPNQPDDTFLCYRCKHNL